MEDQFQKELKELINRHSKENGSNTPDFVLAAYLKDCLEAYNRALSWREQWCGRGAIVQPAPNGGNYGIYPQHHAHKTL